MHSEFTFKLHSIDFDIFDDFVREGVSKLVHKKFLAQSKKIASLIENPKLNVIQPLETIPSASEFINLTDVVFDNEEVKMLSKNPNYCPFINNSKENTTLIVESEMALKSITEPLIARAKITRAITSHTSRPGVDSKTIKSIKHKITENSLIATKADKANSIVILTKEEYISKVNDFSETENLTLLKKDPTPLFQTQIKQLLNNTRAIFSDGDKYKIINTNPAAPRLYGLIKTHKEHYPIRLVVSYINSPARKLAKPIQTLHKIPFKIFNKKLI